MAVLITSWLFGVANPKLKVLLNVLIIVFGVALASFGEIQFVWLGFFFQVGGIVFEAIRLVMIQILLSGDGQNMDPLVSLYYYAPVCALMNFLVAAMTESSSFQFADVWRVGVFTLLLNAGVAFMLNVASVFLVRIWTALPNAQHELTFLDWQNFRTSHDVVRCFEEYPSRWCICTHLGNCHYRASVCWIWNCYGRPRVLWSWI